VDLVQAIKVYINPCKMVVVVVEAQAPVPVVAVEANRRAIKFM